MTFIKLTTGTSAPILIHLDLVTTVRPHYEGGTSIEFIRGETHVAESFEHIVQKIEQAKTE